MAIALPDFSWQLPIAGRAWVCIVITLIAGFGANFFATMAMKHLHAGIVGALTKTAICWALLFLYFKDGSTPSSYEFGAYSLTLLAVVLLQKIQIPRKPFCHIQTVNIDWDSSGFKNRATTELPKFVQLAERVTSCEFKFHLDNLFQGEIKKETKRVFETLRLNNTELRNGVLIAFYKQSNQAAIYFDSGISTQVSGNKLRRWALVLLGLNDEHDFFSTIGPRIEDFAADLSGPFPIAIDDINELSDEVSLVWE